VNTEASTVNWNAYHNEGLNPRVGTTKATGTFTVENGALTAGSLVSVSNTWTTDPKAVDPAMSDGKTSADLDAHLKNEDFFDVTKYPSVKFDITKLEDLAAGTESNVADANKTVSGILTIYDTTVN